MIPRDLLNLVNMLLFFGLVALALAIVYTTGSYRQYSAELRHSRAELDELKMEQARLRLEQSTLSDYRKIIDKAENQLYLRTPLLEQHVRVTP